jgi:hypothetical protein
MKVFIGGAILTGRSDHGLLFRLLRLRLQTIVYIELQKSVGYVFFRRGRVLDRQRSGTQEAQDKKDGFLVPLVLFCAALSSWNDRYICQDDLLRSPIQFGQGIVQFQQIAAR